MRYSEMGHSDMRHSEMGHSDIGDSEMGHSKMGHGEMEHRKIGHSYCSRIASKPRTLVDGLQDGITDDVSLSMNKKLM
jgi:hypothetical protein